MATLYHIAASKLSSILRRVGDLLTQARRLHIRRVPISAMFLDRLIEEGLAVPSGINSGGIFLSLRKRCEIVCAASSSLLASNYS